MMPDDQSRIASEKTDKSARPLRELIGDAAADCTSVSIRGDLYELGDTILAALEAGGFAVVPKEPTEAMRIAASACDWQAWDGETPRYIVRYRAMLAASNPKEEGK